MRRQPLSKNRAIFCDILPVAIFPFMVSNMGRWAVLVLPGWLVGKGQLLAGII